MMRLFAIAKKELIQLKRDRLSFAMVVILPLVQLLLFGYAIDTDVRNIPTVVYDQDSSSGSRRLARSFESTRYLKLVGDVHSYGEVDDALRGGLADVALVLPPRLQADVRSGRGAKVQLIVNGVDPQTVGSALSAAEGMTGNLVRQFNVRKLDKKGLKENIRDLELVPLIKYNPDRRSAIFVVPGLLGVILTLTMVMFTSIALSRERERGTMEALMVSPCRPWEILLGKLLPYVVVGYVQMSLILLVSAFVFDVPVRGSILLLFALAAPFVVGNLAVGIVFSTIARTQQQAMQLSFFFLLPNILLSGFMFPFHAMPPLAQSLSSALPLTHFLRISRRVILQNAGYQDVQPELIWLTAIVAGLALIALMRFRKKLI